MGFLGTLFGIGKSKEQAEAEITKKCENILAQTGDINTKIEQLLKSIWKDLQMLWAAEVANQGVNAGSENGRILLERYTNGTYGAILSFRKSPDKFAAPETIVQFSNMKAAEKTYPAILNRAKLNLKKIFDLVKIEQMIKKGKTEDAKNAYAKVLRQEAGLESIN